MIRSGVVHLAETAVRKQDLDIVKTNRAIRILLEEANLFLEFQRARPVVVAVEKRNVIAAAGLEGAEEIPQKTAVLVLQIQPDPVGETRGVRSHDRPRAVHRTVLADHDLDIEAGLLHEHALDRLRHVLLVVVGYEANADFRIHAGPDADAHAALRAKVIDLTSSAFS